MALTLINSVDSDQLSTVKRLLTRYCSPTLAGVKPAGLVTFPDDNPAGLHTVVGQYNPPGRGAGHILRGHRHLRRRRRRREHAHGLDRAGARRGAATRFGPGTFG